MEAIMSRLVEAFLDTSFAIALSSPKDQFHHLARELAGKLQEDSTRLITTRAVLLEIGNSLSKLAFRTHAITLLNSLEADPNVELVAMTDDLFHRGFQLFAARPDKEWGLIDCISFVVMQDRNINFALTTDDHFTQAGFLALLRPY